MRIIDASGAILGRLASHVAKLAMAGEEIIVLNCEKIFISGTKETVMARYTFLRDLGGPFHGPFRPRTPERMVKRTIEGMLPHKSTRGREALKRVKCFIRAPEEYDNKPVERIESASSEKLKSGNMIKLGEVSKLLGAKNI